MVIISEKETSAEFKKTVCKWLLDSKCLYLIAWGNECEDWHDEMDFANIKRHDYKEIPDDDYVMTTWHHSEPLEEALWFAGYCAAHPDVELRHTVLLHCAEVEAGESLLSSF